MLGGAPVRTAGLGRGPPPPQVGQVRPARRRAAQVGERPRVPPPAPSPGANPLRALPSLEAGASPPGRLLCRRFRLAVSGPRKPRRRPPRAGTGECGRPSGSTSTSTSTSTTRFPPLPERRGPAGFRAETRAPWGPAGRPDVALLNRSVFSKRPLSALLGIATVPADGLDPSPACRKHRRHLTSTLLDQLGPRTACPQTKGSLRTGRTLSRKVGLENKAFSTEGRPETWLAASGGGDRLLRVTLGRPHGHLSLGIRSGADTCLGG